MTGDARRPVELPFLIAAIVLFAGAIWLGREGLALRYYTSLGPGAGFFPVWLAVLLGVLSLLLGLQALRGRVPPGEEPPALPGRAGAARVATVMAALAGTALLMEPLGFRLTMLPFLFVLMLALGRQKVWVALAISVACAYGGYYLFAVWLGVPLPRGPYGF